MKILAVLSAVLLATGLAFAQAPAKAGKTHDTNVEVVSVDAAANTITFKTDKGETATAPVEADAAKMLSELKPGDKVTVTCRDNDKGEHQAIAKIAKSKAATNPSK